MRHYLPRGRYLAAELEEAGELCGRPFGAGDMLVVDTKTGHARAVGPETFVEYFGEQPRRPAGTVAAVPAAPPPAPSPAPPPPPPEPAPKPVAAVAEGASYEFQRRLTEAGRNPVVALERVRADLEQLQPQSATARTLRAVAEMLAPRAAIARGQPYGKLTDELRALAKQLWQEGVGHAVTGPWAACKAIAERVGVSAARIHQLSKDPKRGWGPYGGEIKASEPKPAKRAVPTPGPTPRPRTTTQPRPRPDPTPPSLPRRPVVQSQVRPALRNHRLPDEEASSRRIQSRGTSCPACHIASWQNPCEHCGKRR